MSKPTWEDIKKLSPEQARASAAAVAPEGVDLMDGEAFVALVWFMAKKFFPEHFEADPLMALTILLAGLVEATSNIPRDDLREVANESIRAIEQTKKAIAENEALNMATRGFVN